MDSYCEHFLKIQNGDFLLDDENTVCKQCISSLENGKLWNGKHVNNGAIGFNPELNTYHKSFLDSNDSDQRLLTSEEHIDTLEDSPLLFNNCLNGEPVLEYHHCHDVLTVREDRRAWKKLLAATCLCLIFMIAEVIGGYLAGSLAVMTDAAHLFSDFIGFNISLGAIWISKRPATKRMTFGFYRAEVLGALISVLTVWMLAIIFSVLAVKRLIDKEYDIDADTMIIVASIGLIINIGMAAVLHGVCHTHSHGLSSPSHSHSSNDNINVRAAAAHVLGDMLQSVGVLTAAIIIKFCPGTQVADPICTLIFSILVIFTTAKVAKDSIWFLLEGSPLNSVDISAKLKCIPHVKHIHSLHIWSLAPGKDAVAVHLAVDPNCDRDLVLNKASTIIKSQISVVSCTIQVEVYNAEHASRCTKCLTADF